MKINKLKYLAISLFINNVKSIQPNDAPQSKIYEYTAGNQDPLVKDIIQNNQNISLIKFILNQDVETCRVNILDHFVSEILIVAHNISNNNIYPFTIINPNNGDKNRYEITKINDLITIKRNNSFIPVDFIGDPTLPGNHDLNYTILALSYITFSWHIIIFRKSYIYKYRYSKLKCLSISKILVSDRYYE